MIIEGDNSIQHQICADCLLGAACVEATELANAAFLEARQEALNRVEHSLESGIAHQPRKSAELEAISVEATQKIMSVDGLHKVICVGDGPGRSGKCGAKSMRASKSC